MKVEIFFKKLNEAGISTDDFVNRMTLLEITADIIDSTQ